MVVRTNIDDGSTTLAHAGGPENPRCQWFYAICTQTPTHHISGPQDDDGIASSVELYCARHYVLTLARHLEVHGPTCEHGGLAEHISDYGALH